MRERNKLRRAWRRNKNSAAYENFRAMRNRVHCMIRIAKKDYYLSAFNNGNSNIIWNKLRHLGLIKAKNVRSLACSVDELNKFFANATVSQEKNCPEFAYMNFASDIVFNDKKLFFKYIELAVISKAFARIKSNATSSDGISVRVIKMVLPYLMPIIEHIYNCSVTSEDVPRIWKSALITPIPKTKHPTSVQHYRSIAILSTISKERERLVSDQIIEFLNENNLLDTCQFAYRRNSSTQTCVIRMLDDIRLAADKRKVTVSIFFDFFKAFDRIQHNILLNKLVEIGFPLL